MLTTVAIVVCLLLSALFSGLEIAFVSSNKMKLELDIKKRNFYSYFLNKFSKSPQNFIVGMLIGNNIVLVVYGIFMGDFLTASFSKIPFLNSPILLLTSQTIVSTLLVLFVGEFIPKAIFRNYANYLLKILALPAYLYLTVFKPVNSLIIFVSTFLIRLVAKDKESKEEIDVRDELRYLLSDHLSENSDGEIDSEIQIFHNALSFSEVKARECMVPRNEIYALEINTEIKELKKMFVETGLSKILIYKEVKDNIVGYVHSFEIFKNPTNIRSILLPLDYVYETNSAKEILDKLLKNKKSIAVVLDEYGGTAGMLTLEDIIEELFGEIEDEHDTEELLEQKISEQEFLFSARLEIDYINEKYFLEIPQDDSYETLGGYIFNKLGTIPEEGAEFKTQKILFKIEKVGNTKIESVRLSLSKD